MKILELVEEEVPYCSDTERTYSKTFSHFPILGMNVTGDVKSSSGPTILYDKPKSVDMGLSKQTAVDAYCILSIEHPLCGFNLP